MYKFHRNQQMSFTDFNQPAGMQMDPENRWVKKAASIPWYDIEIKICRAVPERDRHAGKAFTDRSRIADDSEEIRLLRP